MNAVYIIKEGTHADLIVRNGINANLVTLRNIHAVKEGEAPSLTSTAVESSAASISIEKHGGDSVDLAQSIKAETDDNESEKPSTSKKKVRPGTRDKDVEALAESKAHPSPGRGGVSVSLKGFCGLAGPSGAWKSTIMALVQRMYKRGAGTIEIDGVDIAALEATSFRDDSVLQRRLQRDGTDARSLTVPRSRVACPAASGPLVPVIKVM
ncbi:ABC multidrug transporter SitT [Colletotrichum graminicola M1.001]|uniref:ABC multidrug transporter SitT n=1 Tax=Colletotrichum graminicola (strain M1.001 / M2 / FGSC 10212) TaxID=645133 RepID=E3QPX7_COLGM|nr:ABC multidrug transporter SitT [Colletotrichum graminicola M1.001]EFQ32915.1 ABC multidrug transporter SitT [Colletotrichum graminicola M1.001]